MNYNFQPDFTKLSFEKIGHFKAVSGVISHYQHQVEFHKLQPGTISSFLRPRLPLKSELGKSKRFLQ